MSGCIFFFQKSSAICLYTAVPDLGNVFYIFKNCTNICMCVFWPVFQNLFPNILGNMRPRKILHGRVYIKTREINAIRQEIRNQLRTASYSRIIVAWNLNVSKNLINLLVPNATLSLLPENIRKLQGLI